jgi:hypothetical protein
MEEARVGPGELGDLDPTALSVTLEHVRGPGKLSERSSSDPTMM